MNRISKTLSGCALTAAFILLLCSAAYAYTIQQSQIAAIAQGSAVDPSSGRLYVAEPAADVVEVLSEGDLGTLATIAVGAQPVAVAVDPAHHTVLVANLADNTISFIDQASNAVVATIGVGHAPYAIAVDATSDRAYVANSADATVSVIDTQSLTLVSTLSVGESPVGVALDPALHRAYVVTQQLTTEIIDTTTDQVTGQIETPGAYVDVDTDTHRVYISDVDHIAVYDEVQGSMLAPIVPGFGVSDLALNPATGRLWVGGPGYAVSAFDITSDARLTTLSFTAHPRGFSIDSTRGLLFVTAGLDPHVFKIGDVEPFPPTEPQDVQANVSADGHSVTLDWQAPQGDGGSPVSQYRIYRQPIYQAPVLAGTVDGATTTFIDTPPPSCIQYWYTVTAVNLGGESISSAFAKVTVAGPPPPAPSALTAFAQYGGSTPDVELSWTAPSSDPACPVTGYRVYRGTSSGTETPLAQSNGPNYTDTSAAPRTQYFYRVTAVSSMGESLFSNEASMTLAAPPGVPANVSATAAPAGGISVSWSPPSDDGGAAIDWYQIYRGTSPGTETFNVGIVRGDQLTFGDEAVTNGTTYFYVVRAQNIAGTSGPSVEVSATTFGLPGPPQNVRAAPGLLPGQIKVTWSRPLSDGGSPIESYEVFRRTAGQPEALAGTPTGTSFVDGGLTIGKTYYYVVVAVNTVGSSPTSAQSCAKPFPWLAALGC